MLSYIKTQKQVFLDNAINIRRSKLIIMLLQGKIIIRYEMMTLLQYLILD